MSSDDPAFTVDPEVDSFNEATIKELIGEASSELQLLLTGASLTIKQVLRELTRADPGAFGIGRPAPFDQF